MKPCAKLNSRLGATSSCVGLLDTVLSILVKCVTSNVAHSSMLEPICSIHVQIPYTVTRSEIMQLCGRRAPYIPMNECPVHITIDRTAGRTLDCFVEFRSENDAREVLQRMMKISHGDLRMGSSRLHVTLSNQNALLKAIFPKSKSVDKVLGYSLGGSSRNARSSGGFDGFITDEELTCLVRFANDAERVSRDPDYLSFLNGQLIRVPERFCGKSPSATL